MGMVVKSPAAKTTQKVTAKLNRHERLSIQPVSKRACSTFSAPIISSSSKTLSKIRPASSVAIVEHPCSSIFHCSFGYLVLGERKIPKGSDLRFIKRYWG